MNASKYPPPVAELIGEERLNPLGPGIPNKSVYSNLKSFTIEDISPGKAIQDREMAKSCLAGLWLFHNYLEESHSISQEIHTPTGSYWHGIMHRREPDFGNSGYWFRRVGNHPVFAPLQKAAAEIAQQSQTDSSDAAFLKSQSKWDAFAFISLCEGAYRKRNDCDLLCRQIQLKEWELLFEYCFHQAIGN